MNPHAIQIYTDGSCYKNPGGNGGLAGVLQMPDDDKTEVIFQEGYNNTTNNRMELMALIKALEYIKNNSEKFKKQNITMVEIQTDSDISIRCFNSAETWRKNSWEGLDGRPIKNVDLIKKLLTIKNSIKFAYSVNHIMGKSTQETGIVDKLAKKMAKNSLLKDDVGYIKPRVCKSGVSGSTEEIVADGQRVKIKIFEYGLVSRKKGSLYKVKFIKIDQEIDEKYYAYCSKDIIELLHRHQSYYAQFNNGKLPMIEEVEEILTKKEKA